MSSNVHDAVRKSMIVGVGVEAVLLIGLWVWIGSFSSASLVWGAASGFLGIFAGWLALKQFFKLTPQSRPVASPLT